ncbi:hypothetical protein [Clostridium senegalense]
MREKLWLACTADGLELPLAIESTSAELGEKLNMKDSSVRSSLKINYSYSKIFGKIKIFKLEIDENEN